MKGVDNIVADAIRQLHYVEKSNTHAINAHVRNMILVELCNGYVTNTADSESFQTVYVLIGTRAFTNQLEFARANFTPQSLLCHVKITKEVQ